ncbi:MAG: hypothetical protein JW790_04190 [Dehalococcoidales bacterium]|nr:hypothetical protein [Dehalococcoidales bacterium]
MYKEHPAFKTPEDNKKIWRYMDFIKFADIIDRRKLYFPTVDRLGDPFEGSFPKAYIDYFNANLDKIFRPETWELINREQAPKGFARARRTNRKFVAISCWNMQEESAALWQLYCHSDNGIAIQTTIKRLKNSLKDEKRDVHIGEVEYIDYYSQPPSDSLPDDFFPKPFLYKGKSFKFENEVRAVTELPQLEKISDFHAKFIPGHKGYDVTIDPDLLIENVYLSPMSSKWQKKVVKSLLSKYGLKKKVYQSILDEKPIY